MQVTQPGGQLWNQCKWKLKKKGLIKSADIIEKVEEKIEKNVKEKVGKNEEN